MARVLALDYGGKRTGVAVTDELQLIASGLTTVPTSELLGFLMEYLEKEDVETIVIGEPKQMDNTVSESEQLILKFIDKFQKRFPNINVVRVDERFTSKMAMQSLIDSGVKKMRRRKKELIDEVSATLILQNYLYSK